MCLRSREFRAEIDIAPPRTPLPAIQVLERRFSDQELISKHAKRPMVDLLVVVLMFDHFRREIVEGPT